MNEVGGISDLAFLAAPKKAAKVISLTDRVQEVEFAIAA